MNIVFVHGRGQGGNDAITSRKEWTDGMNAGFTAAGKQPLDLGEIFYPFYGNLLQDFVDNLPSKRPLSRGDAPADASDPFEEQFIQRLAERAGVSEADVMVNEPLATRGSWGWTFGVLQAIQNELPWVADALIGEELEDVKVYTDNAYIQGKVNELVLADLQKGACVVVAHSLGTVVAYNILATHPELKVPLFITAGSPLGIGVITNTLPPLRIPAGHWLNISDKDDIVALYPSLDASTFVDGIENITDINNHDKPHSIARYLSDKRVGKALAEALC